MKSIQLFCAVILLALFNSSVYAKNYYVCDTGNDSNNGSESSPFRSYDKAMDTFNKMFAGDSILFCRGGKFLAKENIRLFNTRCGPASVCTIGAYGNKSIKRPQIMARGITGAFNFENGGDAIHDGGYVINNIILVSNKTSSYGIRLINDVDDVIIDNVHIEGFRVGINVGGVGAPRIGANRVNERITLKKSIIKNNYSQGWLGGGNDILIEDNLFEGNGDTAKFDHNVYLNSPNKDIGISNIIIRRNTLYKSTIVDSQCRGVSLVAHGSIKNLTIEENVIKEDSGGVDGGCWGISVDPGYKSEEKFYNLVIRNNTLLNVGNTAIGCASCVDVVIEGNIIIDESDVLLSGISVPVRKEDSLKSNNVKIVGNSIVLSNDSGFGISIAGENKFEVQSNTISQPSTARNSCISKKDGNRLTNIKNNTCKSHMLQPSADEVQVEAIKVDIVIAQEAKAREKGSIDGEQATAKEKAATIQMQTLVQEQVDQDKRARVASEVAAKAERVTVVRQEKSQQAAEQVEAEALIAKNPVVHQTQASKNENSDPKYDSSSQSLKLGSSSSRAGWVSGSGSSSVGNGWSGTKSTVIVTYSDVLAARDNTDSTQPEKDNADCRAKSSNGKCLLK